MKHNQKPKKFTLKSNLLIIFIIIVLIGFIYWQVSSFEFINFDDQMYVTDNQYVTRGLTTENLKWAFSLSTYENYWHPLTWLSHMIDCELFGMNSGMHHMTNVIIHIINSILLFLTLAYFTGSRGKSAIVGIFFAIHPINVDSVAWVAARKNVLSTMFWMLSMLAYGYYAKKPDIKKYVLLMLLFTLGLLTKPMLVTLPCALLLLDYWPLRRFEKGVFHISHEEQTTFSATSTYRLILEKVPLFVLSGAIIFISNTTLQNLSQMVPTAIVPMPLRIKNALVSYINYLYKTFWPFDLSIFYPFPNYIPFWQALIAGTAIIFISVIAIYFCRKLPFFITGWCWFLGTLVPGIGIVQNGRWPALADRWAYIPLIGVFVAVVWGFEKILIKKRLLNLSTIFLSGIIIFALTTISWVQTGHWKNSISLFSHALEVDPQNEVAHYNLGTALSQAGLTDRAIVHLTAALEINPKNFRAFNNLGNILVKRGKLTEAASHYVNALKIRPDNIEALNNLANVMIKTGQTEKAITYYLKILKINQNNAETHNNLGLAYAGIKRFEKATDHVNKALALNPARKQFKENLLKIKRVKKKLYKKEFELKKQIQIDPNNEELLYELGVFYQKQKKDDQALSQFQKALSVNPKSIKALSKIATIYAVKKKYNKSIDYFKTIIDIEPGNPVACYNLACITSLLNKKEQAVTWLQQAINNGYNNWDNLKNDVDLKNIRETPGFKSLITNHGR